SGSTARTTRARSKTSTPPAAVTRCSSSPSPISTRCSPSDARASAKNTGRRRWTDTYGGDVEDRSYGADSEVGRLRTVVLHRPGPEIKRLTPRNSADLLFDAIPWVEKAQEEHDAFADT